MNSSNQFIDYAWEQATISLADSGVAAGAVLVKGAEIVARSHDRTRQLNDPIAVAEVDCIRQAGRRNDQKQLTLYSTRYPDMLTAGTLLQFSIGELVVALAGTDSEPLALLKQKQIPVRFEPDARCMGLL